MRPRVPIVGGRCSPNRGRAERFLGLTYDPSVATCPCETGCGGCGQARIDNHHITRLARLLTLAERRGAEMERRGGYEEGR